LALGGGTVVITEKSTDALSAVNGTGGAPRLWRLDQLIAKPLVVAFALVIRHEVGEG
jgi:hypothetical protein